MAAPNRSEKLQEVFTDQLVHWGLGGNREEVQDVVAGLLLNIDPARGWGAPGRSKTAAALESAHREVLLKYYKLSPDHARSLATALVMWEVITAAKEDSPHLRDEEISLVDADGLSATRKRRILFVVGEWLPRNGGISTFNVALAGVLAQTHQVASYLPSASDDDLQAAAAAGVTLFTSEPSEFLDDLSAQLLVQVPQALKDFSPELVVGHDRRTGGIAIELCDRHFPEARSCVIAHTAPHAIERLKTDRKSTNERAAEAKQRADKLSRILRRADHAFAVGPRLKRKLLQVTGSSCTINVLTPGATILDKPAPSGKQRFILLFGRAEDAALKGVDLAHDVARTLEARFSNTYEWTIRGVPDKELPAFIERYPNFGLSEGYTPDPKVIEDIIARASLIVMPSLEEGFGLVALEAIGHNRPVLISAESGVAEYLKAICPDDAKHFVVSTRDLSSSTPDEKLVIENWVEAIERTFNNWESTMAKLQRIRNDLSVGGGWKGAEIEFLAGCFPIQA